MSPSCVFQVLQRLVIGGGVPVEEAERTIASVLCVLGPG